MAKNIEVTLTLDTKKFKGQLAGAERQMKSFGGSAGVAKGSIIGLAARFAPLAAAAVGVSAAFKQVGASVGAARKIQDIGVVLKNVVGDAEGGALALQQVRDIAQELPFAFEEIAGATPALATVSKDLNELEENTRLAADIAAVTGLSFQDASSQLQRALSAGAGAADMFREKGVLSMAGFEAGASYSIDETRKKLKEFGESIDGAANDLNKTLTGSLSQAGDRFFQFQAAMGDAIVPEFTAFINKVVEIFDANKEGIQAFAKSVGEGVVNAFYSFLEVGAVVVDFLTMLFNTFKSVASFIQENFGEVIGNVMNFAVKAIAGVVEAVGFLGKQIGRLVEFTTGNSQMKDFFENIEAAANKARTGGIEQVKVALEDLGNAVPETKAQDFVAKLIEDLRAAGVIADEEAEKIKAMVEEQGEAANRAIENGGSTLNSSLADYKSASEEILSTANEAFTKLGDDLATALLEGGDIMSSFKDLFKEIIKEMIAQALKLAVIQPILNAILGPFGFGATLSGGSFSIGKLTTPKAVGGPVMKNKPYLVGEMGPEIFTPLGSGTITSNASSNLGGGQAVTYNINAVDARSFKQLVAEDPEFIYSVTRLGERRLPA